MGKGQGNENVSLFRKVIETEGSNKKRAERKGTSCKSSNNTRIRVLYGIFGGAKRIYHYVGTYQLNLLGWRRYQ